MTEVTLHMTRMEGTSLPGALLEQGFDKYLYDHTLNDTNLIRACAIGYFAVMIALGTFGNGVVLCTFVKHRPLRAHSINIFMTQTSAINLFASLLVNVFYVKTLICDEYLAGLVGVTILHGVNVISMFSLCTVGINRYLLITRPQTVYMSCCVRRSSLARVMVGSMTLALIHTAPGCFLLGYYTVFQDDGTRKHLIDAVYRFSVSVSYVPMVVIPAMHILTLRAIGKSRRRVQSRRKVASFVDTSQRNHPHSHHSDAFGVSATSGSDVAKIITTRDALSLATKVATPDTHVSSFTSNLQAPTSMAPDDVHSTGSSQTTCETHSRNWKLLKKWRPVLKQDIGKGEIRIIKMMILMYIVLILPMLLRFTCFSLIATTVITGRVPTVAYFYGYFIPLYPATMPYIFLWSHKKFRSAACQIFGRKKDI